MKEDQESLSTQEIITLKNDLVSMAERLDRLASRLQIAARINPTPTKIVVVNENGRRNQRDIND